MFRLFEARVEGRLVGGVPAGGLPANGGAEEGGPSEAANDFTLGGGAVEAGRRGGAICLGESSFPNSVFETGAVPGGAVACRGGGGVKGGSESRGGD